MAEALIDSLSDDQLDPARYRDVHRETLDRLSMPKPTGVSRLPDLGRAQHRPTCSAPLRASIEAAKQRTVDRNGGPRRSAEPVSTAKKKVKTLRERPAMRPGPPRSAADADSRLAPTSCPSVG